jgi:hypothetical protein
MAEQKLLWGECRGARVGVIAVTVAILIAVAVYIAIVAITTVAAA